MKKTLFQTILAITLCIQFVGFIYSQPFNTNENPEAKNRNALETLEQTRTLDSFNKAVMKSLYEDNVFFGGTTILNESDQISSDLYNLQNRFGRSVAIDGNTAIVGDPLAGDSLSFPTGAAYIYVLSNNIWVEQAKLVPNSSPTSRSFGTSVAIDGDQAVIGAERDPSNGVNSGSAFYFERNGTSWTQKAKLVGSGIGPGDKFGNLVAIDNNEILVTSPLKDGPRGEPEVGAVYVFEFDGSSWIETDTLFAMRGGVAVDWGSSIAIDGNRFVGGASSRNEVFVFEKGSSLWRQRASLLPHTLPPSRRFGASVDLDQGTVVVGTPNETVSGVPLAGAAYVFTGSGTSWQQRARLTASDPGPADGFGWSIGIDAGRIAIGSRQDDNGGTNAGSVYTFTGSNSNWTQEVILRSNPTIPLIEMGRSVAISGSSIISGAPSPNNSIVERGGAAYIFSPSSRGSFSQKARLLPGDGSAGDKFGTGVAVVGDTAVVSAIGDLNGKGSIYIFDRIGNLWAPRAKVVPASSIHDFGFGAVVAVDTPIPSNSDSKKVIVVGAPDDGIRGQAYGISGRVYTYSSGILLNTNLVAVGAKFGTSVDVSSRLPAGGVVTTAVVGAPNDIHDGITGGAAYVFRLTGNTTWVLEAKIFPNDGQTGDKFGQSVSIDGEKIVVGAPQNDDDGTDSGSAYVFTRSGSIWTQQTKITANDSTANDRFGTSVAIHQTNIVIGAEGDSDNGSDSGSAYIFTGVGPNWSQLTKLKPTDGVAGDTFGQSVKIDGNHIVIASPGRDENGSESGSAYVFKSTGSNWQEFRKINASDGVANDQFSKSVDISGLGIIAGAPFRNVTGFSDIDSFINTENLVGNDQGSSYFFDIPDEPFAPRKPIFDFDGDNKTDISIFRPGPGEWWYLKSSDGGNFATQFGSSTDELVPADFTGDGKTDIAFWRPSSGEWFVLRSENLTFFSFPFGTNGDIPAPGDFDGDGKADAAVFRPSNATWFISRSSDGGTDIIGFGTNGDKPVVADYDGDGKDDIAIFRPSVSEWWLNRSQDGVVAYQFGATGDKTVQGDYTGDGKADVAVFQPTTGEWLVLRSENDSFFGFPFGTNGDIASPGDYDGDGVFDATVFRPSTATWFINGSTSGTQIVGFGVNSDIPLPSAYSVP